MCHRAHRRGVRRHRAPQRWIDSATRGNRRWSRLTRHSPGPGTTPAVRMMAPVTPNGEGHVQIDPKVASRNVELTEPQKEQIRAGIRELERVFDRLTSCRIMVDQPDQRHRTGNLYHVRIDLTMAGSEIVVSRSPTGQRGHENLRQALGEAFDRARRALVELARKQRGDIKSHAAPAHGRVARLSPEYGFILASDGHEVYFHRNSVVRGEFERLEEGAELRYVVESGEEGPQASTVHVVGKHHIVDRAVH